MYVYSSTLNHDVYSSTLNHDLCEIIIPDLSSVQMKINRDTLKDVCVGATHKLNHHQVVKSLDCN